MNRKCNEPILTSLCKVEALSQLIACRGLRWSQQDDPDSLDAMAQEDYNMQIKLIHSLGMGAFQIHRSLLASCVALSHIQHMEWGRNGPCVELAQPIKELAPHGSLLKVWVRTKRRKGV